MTDEQDPKIEDLDAAEEAEDVAGGILIGLNQAATNENLKITPAVKLDSSIKGDTSLKQGYLK